MKAKEAHDQLKLVLGNTSPHAKNKPFTILNQAGRYLCSMWKWNWQKVVAKTLGVRGQISITNGKWTESTKTLFVSSGTPFAAYDFVDGDQLTVEGGTNAIQNIYEIASKTNSTTLILKESLSDTAGDLATGDITLTLKLYNVLLPADLQFLIAARALESRVSSLRFTTPEDMLDKSINDITAGSSFWWGTLFYAGSPPKPHLRIFPTPNEDDADEFIIMYGRRWIELKKDTDTVELDDWMEMLYIQLVRAFALGLDVISPDGTVKLDHHLETIHRGRVYATARKADNSMQRELGPLRNGAVRGAGRYHTRTFTEPIGGPV